MVQRRTRAEETPRAGSGDHHPALEALGLSPRFLEPLARYLDLVARWSRRINLTGAETPERRVELLIRDPLAALSAVESAVNSAEASSGESGGEPGPLLDIGSGNGSPGLVLAVLLPPIPVTLLEPRQHRWAFLREASRVLGRPDIEVLRVRHHTHKPARLAHVVTLRGLALPLAEIEPLVAPGGHLFVFGGRPQPSRGLWSEGQRPLPHAALHVFRRR